MHGQMMNMPLLISSLLQHADRYNGDSEIVSRMVSGEIHRYTYREAHARTCQFANALVKLGARPGDRLGTLAWNTHRHYEAYFGISGIGAISHTINPRLFPEQISYIINHAEDKLLFIDETFIPLVEKLSPQLPTVEKIIILTDKTDLKTSLTNWISYEALISDQSDEFEWPTFDEHSASSLCYTSGTTGNPKGVLYSHRSTMIHTYTAAMPDAFNISAQDVIMPIVPMFHVNAWGLPYVCTMTGSKIVFPGPAMDGQSLYQLMEEEDVTLSAGVPTIWAGLESHLKDNQLKLPSLKRIVVGGSACPDSMIRSFEMDHNVEVAHAWGMTELSPLGTFNTFKAKHVALEREAQLAFKGKQGKVLFGVEMKIVDDGGNELPWDGKTFGDLLVRGPNVLSNYFQQTESVLIQDERDLGWFDTGDVATIDPDGYLQITDRSKDVIKSGGEWISSIEIENTAVSHPEIIEAAVIAMPHPKWDERPLLIVVKKQNSALSREEVLEFFLGKVAKWCIPDDVVFVAEIPHTATGKILKTKLREDFSDYKISSV
ncbi:MAG: long-chain-fatty-acid--CoA ligase [Burkholderiales bacterium]|nr:long-chain-fatty-acid--CoA ligase [Burkholderiales bacterium]OUT79250.1 MAG: long-chain fatty acid--CoA ligase [Betaproteobacteria bacterium TMED22]